MRIGIIGIEFGQRVLLPAFRAIDECEVYGIAASSFERAQQVAAAQNIPRAYHSWKAMVDDPGIDALVIAVPPMLQQDIIEAALFHNKPIFCEKPLALSSALAEKFMLETQRRKLANMIDFEFCAIPAWQLAKDTLSNNMLGQLKLGQLNWQTETYVNRLQLANHWKMHAKDGGGVLFNFLPHILFNLEWLCGPISEVLITNNDNVQYADEAIHGILKFQQGLVFNICVGTSSKNGSGHRIEIYGEQGSLQLVNATKDVVKGFTFARYIENNNAAENFFLPAESDIHHNQDGRIAAVTELAKRFVYWIKSGETQEPSFIHGHRVSILLEACQMSLRLKRWISLSHFG